MRGGQLVDTITVLDLAHDEQSALDELVTQWRAKRTRNNLRSAFYDMKNSERALMSGDIPDIVRRRRFVLGWSSLAVDKLNRRCNVDGFWTDQDVDLDELGLRELVRENRLMTEIPRTGLASLTHSTAFLVSTLGDVQSGEPDVLLMGKTAGTATGMWDWRRRCLRSFLSLNAFDDKGEPVDMTLYLPDLLIVLTKVGGRWLVDRRRHVYGVPVDPIVYKGRLDRPFGQSRITRAVMSIHQQALAAMIRADVNGEAYSLPRYVLLGATESAFKNADGSSKASWEAAWDAVWAISDDDSLDTPRRSVKQFNGQSPEPQNAHLRMLAQMFSGETGIPIGELGIIGDANPTSYEAMQASRDDIITEAEQTTDGWTPDLSAAMTRALAMKNRGRLPGGLEVMPRWRNPMHTSRAAAADAGTKVLDKLPWLADSEVGLELMGLTPDQIRRAQADRRRQRGTTGILDALRGAAADAGSTE